MLLLLAEVLLWLSNWLGWPAWHKGYAVLVGVAIVGAAMVLLGLWWAVALIVRWRFQFGIRTLLVLVVAVAVPCSWLEAEMKQASGQATAVATIRNFHFFRVTGGGGPLVLYDY